MSLCALMIVPVNVVTDKGIDLLPQIAMQVVVFQQDADLEDLVPTLNLALDLG